MLTCLQQVEILKQLEVYGGDYQSPAEQLSTWKVEISVQ